MADSFKPLDLTKDQLDLIEHMVDPEVPTNFAAFARERGLKDVTVRGWKNLPRFKRALGKRLDELNIAPDRLQAVLDNMYKLATTGSDSSAVNAAKTLIQYAERLEPARKPIEDRSVKDLTDEELEAQLRERLETQQRRLRAVK